MLSLAPQEGHRLNSIGSHVQMDCLVGSAEHLLRQPDIAKTVFDE
jgi:hypothetical protein